MAQLRMLRWKVRSFGIRMLFAKLLASAPGLVVKALSCGKKESDSFEAFSQLPTWSN